MVFLSWSKTLSNKLALVFKDFAARVFKDEEMTWISNGVPQGEQYFSIIREKMLECQVSIIFLTRDNIANPWIHYELGFFQADNKLAIPILFDSMDIYSETKMTPFEHLQVKLYDKQVMLDAFVSIKKVLGDELISLDKIKANFNDNYDAFNAKITEILNTTEYYDIDSINDIKFMLTKSLRLLNQDNRVLYFEHGFETHDFYSFVLKNARKRLYVFGRKNKKIFDRSNLEDFKAIATKFKNNEFDLRILGFNPNADENLLNAAQKKTNFKESLRTSICDAVDLLDECGLNYKDIMKFYSAYRNELIVIMDNCVFFTNVGYDNDGKPFHLTNSSFYLCDINSAMGHKMSEIFDKGYENSIILNLDEIKGA